MEKTEPKIPGAQLSISFERGFLNYGCTTILKMCQASLFDNFFIVLISLGTTGTINYLLKLKANVFNCQPYCIYSFRTAQLTEQDRTVQIGTQP